MPIESKLLLGAALFICVSMATCASEERIERCRTPPKLVIENPKSEYSPPSTARPPLGIVVLEMTVSTDGTIRDVSVVEPVDSRLQRWAIEESKNLRFEPVSTVCRTRITLESRITDESGV